MGLNHGEKDQKKRRKEGRKEGGREGGREGGVLTQWPPCVPFGRHFARRDRRT